MASVDVVSVDNQKKGKVDLPASVFEVAIKPHLHHAEVRRQLAGRHRGTHSTKNRAAVSGGGSKPWRQKGTGRARQGTTRAAQWAGGGSVFGPVPRGYDHALPKKMRSGALRSALSAKVAEDAVVVVESFAVEPAKTKRVTEILGGLGVGAARVLVVLAEADEAAERATRNLPRVRTLRVDGLNTYDVLWADRLVLARDAVDRIEQRLGAAAGRAEA